MSAIETEPVAATELTESEAPASRAPESGTPEADSSPSRRRRAPYTRPFRGFLEQLGEDPHEFDQLRRSFWEAFRPEDGFEEDLLEDLVENRWRLRRLMRAHQAKLVENRRRTEMKRQQRLASEGRGVPGMAQRFLMTQQGVTALPDSKYKFERTIIFLRELAAIVELDGFTEWGSQCLRVTFGEKPGLTASELVMGYEAGRKTEAEGDEEAQQTARRQFLVPLREEIAAYQKLQALYREGAIEIPEATRDAEMLLNEKDLTNLLRQERMLELEYQLKLEQWAGWRRGKQAGAAGDPDAEKGAAVPDSGSAPSDGGKTARGPGLGRRVGRPPSLAGLKV
jgi:hypothetical protein